MLVGVEVNIVDDTNPYRTLLGINWAFDNQVIISPKKRKIVFETEDLRFTAPLDPMKGEWYVEPVKYGFSTTELGNIYNTKMHMEDYVNPTTNEVLSCWSVSSCASDSDASFDKFCTSYMNFHRDMSHITYTLHWIRTKVHNPLRDDEMTWMLTVEVVLGAILMQRCVMPQIGMREWHKLL